MLRLLLAVPLLLSAAPTAVSGTRLTFKERYEKQLWMNKACHLVYSLKSRGTFRLLVDLSASTKSREVPYNFKDW